MPYLLHCKAYCKSNFFVQIIFYNNLHYAKILSLTCAETKTSLCFSLNCSGKNQNDQKATVPPSDDSFSHTQLYKYGNERPLSYELNISVNNNILIYLYKTLLHNRKLGMTNNTEAHFLSLTHTHTNYSYKEY